jgi:hypothetical protein
MNAHDFVTAIEQQTNAASCTGLGTESLSTSGYDSVCPPSLVLNWFTGLVIMNRDQIRQQDAVGR